MIKHVAKIDIVTLFDKLTGKTFEYHPEPNEVLKGIILDNNDIDYAILVDGVEMYVSSFKGCQSTQVHPQGKVFYVHIPLGTHVTIKANCGVTANSDLYFITENQQ